MRALRFLNVTILTALVATSAALYSQDEKRQDPPSKQEAPRPEGQKPEMNQKDETKPAKQNETKPSKQEKQAQKEEQGQEKQQQSHDQMKQPERQQQEMKPAQQANHGQLSGKGGHIPDEKFHSNFGRSHKFVVQRTVVVEGRPGFSYGGYSFVFVDAWPSEWAYTDDCYVDYIDGEYFLFNLFHPGVRIALFVVL
jgi:hypothetical protein